MPLSDDPIKRRKQLDNLTSRPPATPIDNDFASTHGGYARVAAERAEAKVMVVFDALGCDAPLREHGELPAADAALVHVCAEAMCRLEDVRDYLTTYGIVDLKTKALRTTVIELEGRLRREIGDHLDALGMSPRSRAKLGVDVRQAASLDVASIMSEPDAAIRAQLLRRAGLLDPPGGVIADGD
jgi:hypothetical protein